MIPSLEGLPTKAKEAPSPHEVRLSALDTNPVFHSLGVLMILMIVSPLIMQRLHTVYPTNIYSRTFNVTPNE